MLTQSIKKLIQIGLVSVFLAGTVACAPEYREREESVREREGMVEPGVGEREGVIGREGVEEREVEEREVEVERD